MTRCDLMIRGGDVLDPETPGSSLADHSVVIVDDHIVDVAPRSEAGERWRPRRTIDASGCVIAPGFVDAHVHLSAFLMTPVHHTRANGPSLFGGGAGPEDLVTLVAQMTSMPIPAEVTSTVLRPVFAALLAAGFTSVVDAGGSGLDGIIDAAEQTGIRLATGPSLADMWNHEGEFGRQADSDSLLADAETFIGRHDRRADGRIRALVSAVETTACTDDLLRGIARLAKDADVHAALMAHREAGGTDNAIVLEDVVGMATNSGPVMGRPGELGTIRAGQLADLVVLDTSAPPPRLTSR